MTLLLPEDELADLLRAAQARGVSLSDLLGEAAALLVYEERLRALRSRLEQPATAHDPPSG